MLSKEKMLNFIAVLEEELVPATGCTEPIAIAYAAAKLRAVLGARPEKIRADISGNIIKNTKSVVVPNTGGLKGIGSAIAAGIVVGKDEAVLQVIGDVSEADKPAIAEYMNATPIEIRCADTPVLLDIQLRGWAGEHSAFVRIAESHSNVVRLEKDGEVLLDIPVNVGAGGTRTDRASITVEDIVAFANEVEIDAVKATLDRQISYNSAIAEEGMKGNWGANIGSVLMQMYPGDIAVEARAYAAAGSDARMSGCEMPVVIVSGSGNQGMTASVPVIRYAKHLGVSEEKLYRALVVSDLVTIHQKTGIGRLSAYCGAVSAGVGAGAGIAYLLDGSAEAVAATVTNGVAILSGTICDGAKPSCAAKIASSVEAGILGYRMYRDGQKFSGGDGILHGHVEETITNVGILAREGMRQTDEVILKIMTERC
ncbi:MAG: serine dehydratase subunit alpha family protein [Oscillospiraceae bacterium]|nr:serine dehydratase subunit alpha family protein [Oscillospiraceae bacterium]MBR6678426.1 serine dehydratase subunit alpha family protein [Oscillospiraceae bacterium]